MLRATPFLLKRLPRIALSRISLVFKSNLLEYLSSVLLFALETAGLMLGTDKSRGYCLEMICADFLAGANLPDGKS